MKKLYTIMFMVFAITIFAQQTIYSQQSQYTISGYVRDSVSGEPLVGVTITDTQFRGTTTNSYGFYSLNIKANSKTELLFSYINYTPISRIIIAAQDATINIFLVQQSLVIDQVIVKADPLKLVAVGDVGSVRISSKQLKFVPSFLGEHDILKYFQLQPGVSSGKEGSSGLNLRGGSADQTLILIDDVPIYNHSHAFGFTSIFSGEYIKSAELYKGYIPSTYGGRLSGVATMNIKEGNRYEHKQSVQLGTTTLSALAEGPLSKGVGSYLVGGRYFVPDLFMRLASVGLSSNGGLAPVIGFYDVTAKVSYDLNSRNTIYGSFYTGRDAMSVITKDETISIENGSLESDMSGLQSLNWGNIIGSVRLSSQLSNKLFLNSTAYYSHLLNNNKSSYTEKVEDIYQSTNIKSQMGEFGVKMHFQHNVNSLYYLSYGANFSNQNFIPQNITLEKHGHTSYKEYGTQNLLAAGVFVDNKLNLGMFNINIGGRVSLYSSNSESKLAFEPRASLTLLMPESSLWVSYVQNSQPLFSMEQQYLSLPIDYWLPFQDKDKLPESQQLSIGYKHAFNFGFEFFAEAYYKKSNNIAFVFNNEELLLDEGGYNLAKGDAYGAEFMVQYQKRKLSIMLSYAYSKSQYDIDGKVFDFMYDTPHNVNIFALYEVLKRGDKTHNFSINANFKTGLPYIMASSVYPITGGVGSSNSTITDNPISANGRLNNFFRVDINYSMEKKLKKGRRIWQLSILNATAHKNPYVVYAENESYFSSAKKYKAISIIPFMPSVSYTRMF